VHRLYGFSHARHLVQKARKKAELGKHVTMDACRHGGMTELGDAEATEQEIMSASGHRSPDAARVYVKRTEKQRMAAVRKRRQLRTAKA
jgi:integrase